MAFSTSWDSRIPTLTRKDASNYLLLASLFIYTAPCNLNCRERYVGWYYLSVTYILEVAPFAAVTVVGGAEWLVDIEYIVYGVL